ncbi:hypothetical protein GCM10009069_15590 [Algimonas arctica]|uniref:RDD family protein n=1 Tax=Algimonas arctica TaxID=1479486 RepID=A0A8J3G244_9PROT|nr:hypothetical protein GCM10009069_15590 [Algimonas arctica]
MAFFGDYVAVNIAFYLMVGLAIRLITSALEMPVAEMENLITDVQEGAALFFVCLYFTVSEIRNGSTSFKDLFGLHVSGTSQQIIKRNMLKFLPVWISLLGNIISDDTCLKWLEIGGTVMVIAGSCLGLYYLSSVFYGPKGTLYDRLSGTVVTYHPTMDRGF